ncbi:DNA adenine methylase [Desulfospira joergensenii]|uniref:DNA adenine methylase n=1 Tax=Desulfospira joergensenii TaxID=53329 RepID=UPI0003B32939|nr:DNA adenine methylase [Desulfospira joergensenii]
MKKRRYPGGKAGFGVYQTIINIMPPHETYIETHLGEGAILRKKRLAVQNYGIDIDPLLVQKWINSTPEKTKIIQGDAVKFLDGFSFTGKELVYCDPPYLKETRKTGRIYRYEYTREQHIDLLDCIVTLPCKVIISGYFSKLYSEKLSSWNVQTFQAQTSGGIPATEYLWFNFEKPLFLHDPQYIGKDYRERERIKKKASRWVNRFESLPMLEKQAIMAQLEKSGVFEKNSFLL